MKFCMAALFALLVVAAPASQAANTAPASCYCYYKLKWTNECPGGPDKGWDFATVVRFNTTRPTYKRDGMAACKKNMTDVALEDCWDAPAVEISDCRFIQ